MMGNVMVPQSMECVPRMPSAKDVENRWPKHWASWLTDTRQIWGSATDCDLGWRLAIWSET
jgi:hypothetical protein